MNTKIIYVLIFLSSCTLNNDSRLHDEHAEVFNNFIEKVNFLKKYNYSFYKEIDKFNLVGIGDTIEANEFNLPFHAISEMGDMILSYSFYKNMNYESINYQLFDSFALSTRITKEIEFENVYIRSVTIIRRDY